MRYGYIDGDNIGLVIERSFMENNEANLTNINKAISDLIEIISHYLKIHHQQIIFAGADGLIYKGSNLDLHELLTMIRKQHESITFSIGIGDTLRESYIALRYAKSIGKNACVIIDGDSFETV